MWFSFSFSFYICGAVRSQLFNKLKELILTAKDGAFHYDHLNDKQSCFSWENISALTNRAKAAGEVLIHLRE